MASLGSVPTPWSGWVAVVSGGWLVRFAAALSGNVDAGGAWHLPEHPPACPSHPFKLAGQTPTLPAFLSAGAGVGRCVDLA